MIDIDLEPYCQECSYFDPTIEKFWADNKGYITRISCKNIDRCRTISENIKRHLESKGENK